MNKIKFLFVVLFCLFMSLIKGQNVDKKIIFFYVKDTVEIDTLITYGYIDHHNKIFIPEDLKNKIDFNNGMSKIFCEKGFGFMNDKFELKIPFKYKYANLFYNDLALVQYDEDLLLIDKNDSLVRKLDYKLSLIKDLFKEKNDWKIKIIKNEQIYQIDTNYQINKLDNYKMQISDSSLVPNFDLYLIKQKLNADTCIYLHNNYIGFKKNNLFGLVDSSGTIILPAQYDQITNFYGDFSHLFKIKKNSKYGVFYKSDFLIDPIYDEIFYYNFYYIIKKDNKYSVLDKRGEIIISNFDYCSINYEGIIKVTLKIKNGESLNEKIGYYNYFGEQITPIQFEDGGSFEEGLCAVKMNGKWGDINSFGQFVVQSIYDTIMSYKNDRVFVMYNKKWALLDQYGIAITDFKYDEVKIFSEGYAAVCINKKWGYINKNGQEVTAIIFDYCSNIENGKGYIDIRGKYSEIKIEDLISNY
jgi:hypothetical protein